MMLPLKVSSGGFEYSKASSIEIPSTAKMRPIAAFIRAQMPSLTYERFAAIIGDDSEFSEDFFVSFFGRDDDDLSVVKGDEIEKCLLRCFEERVQLQDNVLGFYNAAAAVYRFYSAFSAAIMVVIIAYCFNFYLDVLFVGAGALMVSTSFAIGESFMDVVESLVFILARRPYEVGDWVNWDGHDCCVKRFVIMIKT